MKKAATFLTQEEQENIELAVKQAESQTSGEIVPMIVDSSYEYPRAELIGAGTLALATGLLVSWLFGGESIWWFVPAYIVSFLIFHCVIRRSPGLKRKLINPNELTAEVKEKAVVSFVEQGLHETRDRTGILILISLFEHRVQVLADSGINAKVPAHTWDQIVDIIIDGLKNKRSAAAICQAIERCGELLQEHFPRKHDDTDELPNLIIE